MKKTNYHLVKDMSGGAGVLIPVITFGPLQGYPVFSYTPTNLIVKMDGRSFTVPIPSYLGRSLVQFMYQVKNSSFSAVDDSDKVYIGVTDGFRTYTDIFSRKDATTILNRLKNNISV